MMNNRAASFEAAHGGNTDEDRAARKRETVPPTADPVGAILEKLELFAEGPANPIYSEAADTIASLRAVNAELVEALERLDAALRTDTRNRTVTADTVEYHLEGHAMYAAINRIRAALDKARSA